MKVEDMSLNDKKNPLCTVFSDCLMKIVKTEGCLALWNGTKPSLILATNPAIQFMVYETIKRYFQRRFHQTVSMDN